MRKLRVEQRSESRYRIQLDASASLKKKLDLARDLMSHSECDLAEIVERGLRTCMRCSWTVCTRVGLTAAGVPPAVAAQLADPAPVCCLAQPLDEER